MYDEFLKCSQTYVLNWLYPQIKNKINKWRHWSTASAIVFQQRDRNGVRPQIIQTESEPSGRDAHVDRFYSKTIFCFSRSNIKIIKRSNRVHCKNAQFKFSERYKKIRFYQKNTLWILQFDTKKKITRSGRKSTITLRCWIIITHSL